MAHTTTSSPPRVGSPLFPLIVATVLATLHTTLWFRLVHGLQVPWAVELLGMGVLAAGALGIWSTLRARFARRQIATWVSSVSLTWLGVAFIGFSVVLALEPLRWTAGPSWGPPLSAAALGATGLLTAWGLVSARTPKVRTVEVVLDGLPPSASGLRIVQLTDVHIDASMPPSWLEVLVGRVNALQPDVIAITGDLVDGSVEDIGDKVALLAELRATHGTFFVTGNHEYYSGASAWCAHLTELGIRVLRNERVRIAEAFDLVGVDDLWGSGDGHGADLARAMRDQDQRVPSVLLAHQPAMISRAAAAGVDLQLSGHTHGGQIFPFHLLVRRAQPALHGLAEYGGTQLYVSRGTGHWGPPLRIGAPAEISLIELT